MTQNRKLDEVKVREIRERRARGETLTALAKAYAVNVGTIWFCVRRHTWKWVI